MAAAAGTGSEYTAFDDGKSLASTSASATGGNSAVLSSDNNTGVAAQTGGKRFKKGSKGAKLFMAKLRAMRSKKGGRKGKKATMKMKGGSEEEEQEQECGKKE